MEFSIRAGGLAACGYGFPVALEDSELFAAVRLRLWSFLRIIVESSWPESGIIGRIVKT
jgi:hypothetical protein